MPRRKFKNVEDFNKLIFAAQETTSKQALNQHR